MKKFDGMSIGILIALFMLCAFVWKEIFFGAKKFEKSKLAFLDVGQGDSMLINFDGVKILTDAGPDRKIVSSLDKILGRDNRYVDLAIISHPQLDHFNGFNYLLENYRFGAFIFNGRSDKIPEWTSLLLKIKESDIPLITLGAGDRIIYGENEIKILSPNPDLLQSAEPNDTGLVEKIKMLGFNAIFAADIGENTENFLAKNFQITADVLKVPHHGSRYSASDYFWNAIKPKVAVIEVGAKNIYGHPAKETLAGLESLGTKVFRTDINGNVEILSDNGKIKIFAEK